MEITKAGILPSGTTIQAEYDDGVLCTFAYPLPESVTGERADVLRAWLGGHVVTDWYTSEELAKMQARDNLAASDAKMARVGEDLINALVAKGVLAMADLPQAAQDHIANRDEWREEIQ